MPVHSGLPSTVDRLISNSLGHEALVNNLLKDHSQARNPVLPLLVRRPATAFLLMKVSLKRLDDKYHFLGTNAAGNTLHLDTGPEEGGSGQGVGPMQAVIMALGGCSGIDIVSILKKQREDLAAFDTEITYERAENETPALFTRIHVHYIFSGDLNPDKVRRAVDLSINKYCSVARILEKTAPITVTWSINGQDFALTPNS